MNFKALLLGDIRFQYRYGFYFVYLIFTILYITLSNILPPSVKQNIVIMMIFSDPTIIGLMFTGAMVHLEQDEKTFQALLVSPVTYKTYTMSKLISFSLIAWIVSLAIGIMTQSISNFFMFTIAIILGSMIFTSFGLILAFITKSLNQFMVYIVPVMILIMIPGGYDLFFDGESMLYLHPGVAIVRLLTLNGDILGAILSLTIWTCIAIGLALFKMKHAFAFYGGSRYASNT